ncbi:MRG/MORF4L-binding protein-like [Littorina saxatilis]|uniref:MRG-binding protein n=1 Tax=Littorina saxatilis TaxID=31220 RepID=A0AAN9GAH2_9CAEN
MGESFQPGAWSVEMEVNLFHAMRSHKPVGVNRHFHMVLIHEKLSSPASKKLTAKNVWDHLSTMYDLQALNESEILPIPNKIVDFKLPGELTQMCEEDFPRMKNVGTEETKAKLEGQAKGGKSSRSETKTTDTKKSSESKNSTPSENRSSQSAKQDSKSSTPSSSRGDGKGGGKGGHSATPHSASSTPDPSPKRTKRTRHNQSAANSPASDAPPTKRRR